MRTALFRHGRRTSIGRRLAILIGLLMLMGMASTALALRAGASGPNVAVLSSNSWSDYLGTTKMLHLVAEVQDSDAQDVSLVRVTFQLWTASGGLIGPETTTGNTGLNVVGHGGNKSPYAADFPAPAGYDHFTVGSVSAAAAGTGPDQNFTITPTTCTDVVDLKHVCGTVTNNNPITVDGVRVVFTFYADAAKTHIADQGVFPVPTNATDSMDANASFSFEFVRAAAAPDWSGLAEVGESSTTTPEAPFGLFATASNASATVTWSAPPDGGRPITSYTVTASPPDGAATVSGGTTSATVSGLHNGTSYTFTVTATNAFGTGPPSTPSNAVVPASVPDAPVITNATPGDSSATITWTAPFNEGSPITVYIVTTSPGGGTTTVPANQLSVTLTGLANGTAYQFTVTAVNALGSGPPSSPSNPVTPATVPQAPANVAAVAGNGQATVSWSAPPFDGGAPITSYTVVSSPDGIVVITNGSARTATVAGLRNGTPYTFTVAATNRAGSTVSAPSNTVTPSGPPPPPPPAPTFGAWERVNGLLMFTPAASTWGPGRLDVFVVGLDGILYHRFIDGGVWHNWEQLAGPPGLTMTSQPTAVSVGVGTIDVFARGDDGALWHSHFAAGSWDAWQRLGGVLAAAPSAVALGSGAIAVFVEGTDQRLYVDSFDGTNWHWSGAGGVLADGPVAVSAAPGTADAFVRGADGALWRFSIPAGWSFIGGRIVARPGPTVRAGGVLDVFVDGADGQPWHWTNAGGGSTWESLGGRMTDSPAAVTGGSSRIDLFVRGTDGALWHDTFDGTKWTWEMLGTPLGNGFSSEPSVVSSGPSHIDVVMRGDDRALWHIGTG